MPRNKHRFLFLIPVLISASCLKIYEPVIETIDANKFVVSGLITDRNCPQVIRVSKASTINKPEALPVSGCVVTVSDDNNHRFATIDSADGNYYCRIDPQFLIPGRSFNVEIITPGGDKIVSDFDRFSSCPEVDSIYYKRKDLLTNDPGKFEKGIQFYVDLNGDDTDSKFYRFETIETWEYHSEYPVELYFSHGLHYVYPPDFSLSICWSTFVTRNIYILSTKNFGGNKYKQFPLHFINNRTQRLVYGYSLLINQYSLSEAAYNYWNQLRINTTNEGGLYEKQPLAMNGNLRNLTHPEQEVLGFFGASSVKSKRIFVKNVENLELETDPTCAFRYVTYKELAGSSATSWPIYLKENTDEAVIAPYILLAPGCVDCRAYGGTTVKPDFWPF